MSQYKLPKMQRYRIVLDVSHDLKTEFKAAAAIRNEDMTTLLKKFINAYIGKQREELNRLIDVYRDKGIEE